MRDDCPPPPASAITIDARTWIAARREREKRALLVRTQGGPVARAWLAVGEAWEGLGRQDDARDWVLAGVAAVVAVAAVVGS